jgi:hypothetical protein
MGRPSLIDAGADIVQLRPGIMAPKAQALHPEYPGEPRSVAEDLLFTAHGSAVRKTKRGRSKCERLTRRAADELASRVELARSNLAGTGLGPHGRDYEAGALQALSEATAFLQRRCFACGLCEVETI